MIFGTTIAPGQTVRTQTFMRQADNAVLRYELIGGQGNQAMTVSVYSKNREDTSWGSAVGTFSTSELQIGDLKEELTIEFHMDSVTQNIDTTPTTFETNNRRVRVLPAQWFNDPTYVEPPP